MEQLGVEQQSAILAVGDGGVAHVTIFPQEFLDVSRIPVILREAPFVCEKGSFETARKTN